MGYPRGPFWRKPSSLWHAYSETRPFVKEGGRRGEEKEMRIYWEKREKKGAYLNLSGRHLEFFGKIFALGCVWLLVRKKNVLKNFEL